MHKWPGVNFSVHNETYEGVEWQGDSPKPSMKEFEKAWSEFLTIERPKILKRLELKKSDISMARITEDLLVLLLDQGIVNHSNFSEEALSIVERRKRIRSLI